MFCIVHGAKVISFLILLSLNEVVSINEAEFETGEFALFF